MLRGGFAHRREVTFPFNGYKNEDEIIEYCTKWINDRDLYKHCLEFPLHIFFDGDTVKMMQRRKLSESLRMPAFNGSVDDVPCEYADFMQIYDSEYNIWSTK